MVLTCLNTQAQQVIRLYSGKAPGAEKWDWKEQEYYHQMTQQRLVHNVVDPTLTVYIPPKGKANGTAVVIAPGGGFHFLSIDQEGVFVAQWLVERGVTAFVLKYRLARTVTNDPFMETMQKINGGGSASTDPAGVALPDIMAMSVADGLAALKYVRSNAAQYGIDPKRIGIMGFSAGGFVTMGAATQYAADSRPDFAAPVYAFTGGKPVKVPADAPPMFLIAASDDQLKLAPHSVQLYNDWLEAGKPVELHMYTKGGHGFGMRKQKLPTDAWIERFGEWLDQQGLLVAAKK